MRPVFAILATTAALCAGTLPGEAQTSGHRPWCAVINYGTSEVRWECYYRSLDECVPNVLAGNRGFCNQNPYWRGPALPAKRQRNHRAKPD